MSEPIYGSMTKKQTLVNAEKEMFEQERDKQHKIIRREPVTAPPGQMNEDEATSTTTTSNVEKLLLERTGNEMLSQRAQRTHARLHAKYVPLEAGKYVPEMPPASPPEDGACANLAKKRRMNNIRKNTDSPTEYTDGISEKITRYKVNTPAMFGILNPESIQSSNRDEYTPALNKMKDVLLNMDMSAETLAPEYVRDHVLQLYRKNRQIQACDGIMMRNEQYIRDLPQVERELLQNAISMGRTYSAMLKLRFAEHGIDPDNGALLRNTHAIYPDNVKDDIEQQYRDKNIAFNESREKILIEEQDRFLKSGKTDVDQQSVFKYGLPTAEDFKNIMLENGMDGKIFEDKSKGEFREILGILNQYHDIMGKEVETNAEVGLKNLHWDAINKLTSASQANAIAKNKEASALGFIAMKAMSYSGLVANIEAEYRYQSHTTEQKQTVQEFMDSHKVISMYEGTHNATLERKEMKDSDGVKLPRLNDTLRTAMKVDGYEYKDDQEALALLMTTEAFDDYLETVQIPPCTKPEDQDVYKEKIQQIRDTLYSFNDRVSVGMLSYLNHIENMRELIWPASHLMKVRQNMMGIIEKREKEDNTLTRVNELLYRLEINDFGNEQFNSQYTGVTLGEAIQKTRLEKIEDRLSNYTKAGEQMSEVYIPRQDSRVKAVLRVDEALHQDSMDAYSLIAGFKSYGGMLDMHKANRDIAMGVLDNYVGANVIARSRSLQADLKDSIIEKKLTVSAMEVAKGVQVDQIGRVGFDMNFYKNPEALKTADENKMLNLAHPESMKNIYMLQALDFISGSVDRHRNNVFAETDEHGAMKSLTGIDNDAAFGYLSPQKTVEGLKKDLTAEYAQVSAQAFNYARIPVLEVAFKCVPKEVNDKIQAIDEKELTNNLRGHLRDEEIVYTIERLRALKEHLRSVTKYDLEKPDEAEQCALKTKEDAQYAEQNDALQLNYFSMYQNGKTI